LTLPTAENEKLKQETEMQKSDRQDAVRRTAIRIGVCVVLLLIGVIGMKKLEGKRKPPSTAAPGEHALSVVALSVESEDVPVEITGYGVARPLNIVSISAEVAARVARVHPRLEVGEIIPEGDILFALDSRDYLAARDEAKASVRQLRKTIERLRKEQDHDIKRFATFERNRALSKAEFDRLSKLLRDNEVGSQSRVDAAETSYNNAVDQADQLTRALELYPIRLAEAESSLSAARARLLRAEANLERCSVKAPFAARVKSVSLEANQYITPGAPVLTIADDSTLEILVHIDSRDARKWLRFDGKGREDGTSWFNELDPVKCSIRWTENSPNGRAWEGGLHRVASFDQDTRTVTLAVRIDAERCVASSGGSLPLVDGMFCSVEIPGRTMKNVCRVPLQAVTLEDTVYLSVSNRLETRGIEKTRIGPEHVFISAGLTDGDVVIATRLIDPLEGALLDVRWKGQD